MPQLLRFSLLCLLVAPLSLVGCKKDAETLAGPVGSWQLTRRSCYCSVTALPNEKLIFTSTGYSSYRNDTLTATGTYGTLTTQRCNGKDSAPTLRLTAASSVTWATHDALYTISGNTLTLDYNTSCVADAPVETYERLP